MENWRPTLVFAGVSLLALMAATHCAGIWVEWVSAVSIMGLVVLAYLACRIARRLRVKIRRRSSGDYQGDILHVGHG